MTLAQYLLVGLAVAHLVFAAFTIFKTVKTIEFSKKQKVINIVLILLIPFIWSILIYYILKPGPPSYEIEVKNDVSSNNFYESGKGAPGGGISDL